MNLFLTHALALLVGFGSKYLSDYLFDKYKRKVQKTDKEDQYLQVFNLMPELINEMKEDLKNPEFTGCLSFFVLPTRNVVINTGAPHFRYSEDEHIHLQSHIATLINLGFVHHVAKERYSFDIEFANHLKSIQD